MIYRIFGGLGLVLLGLVTANILAVPVVIIGVILFIGGIALLAGI